MYKSTYIVREHALSLAPALSVADSAVLYTVGYGSCIFTYLCSNEAAQRLLYLVGQHHREYISWSWITWVMLNPTTFWFYSWTRLDSCESRVLLGSICEQYNCEFWVISAHANFCTTSNSLLSFPISHSCHCPVSHSLPSSCPPPLLSIPCYAKSAIAQDVALANTSCMVLLISAHC